MPWSSSGLRPTPSRSGGTDGASPRLLGLRNLGGDLIGCEPDGGGRQAADQLVAHQRGAESEGVGPRAVGITGGLLFGLGIFLSAFAGESLPLLYVTYGLVPRPPTIQELG